MCQIAAHGLTERHWPSVGASQHLPGGTPSCNREFERKSEKAFSAISIAIGYPVGPCRARRKDQEAQFVCSLLCAHQLFQNNSSTKPSNVHEDSGEVTVRFPLGHVPSPIHRLFFLSECPSQKDLSKWNLTEEKVELLPLPLILHQCDTSNRRQKPTSPFYGWLFVFGAYTTLISLRLEVLLAPYVPSPSLKSFLYPLIQNGKHL